jgi:hypothetical protein
VARSLAGQSSYHVYVVELRPEAAEDRACRPRCRLRRRPGRASRVPNAGRPRFVYVGSTAKSPEARFAQHKLGEKYRSSKCVKAYGLWLLPPLYEHINPIPSRPEAERAEAALAKLLRARGYTVFGAQAWRPIRRRRLGEKPATGSHRP